MTLFHNTFHKASLFLASIAILCFAPHTALAAGAVHRADGNIDSWVALLILVASVLVAAGVNGTKPTTRIAGTLLASLGCFAVVAWFGFYALDVVANPRPHVLPVDAAKPALLWTQTGIALVVAFALLWTARWQASRTDRLDLPTHNTPDTYGKATRILHWTIAILMIALIPIGIFASMIPEDAPYRIGYYVAHKTLGFCVLGLVIARLAWHMRVGRPALSSDLKTWERRLAHTTHFILYMLMIGLPMSGFVMSTFGGKTSYFFLWNTPMLWGESEQGVFIFGVMHKVVLPYLLYIFLGAHILGALKHQFIDKHAVALRRIAS